MATKKADDGDARCTADIPHPAEPPTASILSTNLTAALQLVVTTRSPGLVPRALTNLPEPSCISPTAAGAVAAGTVAPPTTPEMRTTVSAGAPSSACPLDDDGIDGTWRTPPMAAVMDEAAGRGADEKAFASAMTASATSNTSPQKLVDRRRFISSRRPANLECNVGVPLLETTVVGLEVPA